MSTEASLTQFNVLPVTVEVGESRAILQRFALSGAYVVPPLTHEHEPSITVTDASEYSELTTVMRDRCTPDDVTAMRANLSSPTKRKIAGILSRAMLAPEERVGIIRRSHARIATDVGSGALRFVELDDPAYLALLGTCVRDEWGRTLHPNQAAHNSTGAQTYQVPAKQQRAFSVEQAASGIFDPRTSQMERTAFVLTAFYNLSQFTVAQVMKRAYRVRHDAFVNTPLAIERVRQRAAASS